METELVASNSGNGHWVGILVSDVRDVVRLALSYASEALYPQFCPIKNTNTVGSIKSLYAHSNHFLCLRYSAVCCFVPVLECRNILGTRMSQTCLHTTCFGGMCRFVGWLTVPNIHSRKRKGDPKAAA